MLFCICLHQRGVGAHGNRRVISEIETLGPSYAGNLVDKFYFLCLKLVLWDRNRPFGLKLLLLSWMIEFEGGGEGRARNFICVLLESSKIIRPVH